MEKLNMENNSQSAMMGVMNDNVIGNIANLTIANNNNFTITGSHIKLTIEYIGYVTVPLLLLLGITGNILTVFTMRCKPFSRTASSCLIACLAVSDSVVNLLLPFNKVWVQELLGTDVRSYSEASCQGFYWAFRTAKMGSSWLVVLICVERFVAVCASHTVARVVCRKSTAVFAVVGVYVAIGAYNSVWVAFADRIVDGSCRPNAHVAGLVDVNRGFLIVGLCVYCFVPCVILTILTSLIIRALHSRYRKAHELQQRTRILAKHRDKVADPARKMTAMLLSVIIAFIVLVLPISLTHLIAFIRKTPIFASKDPTTIILREVATLLEHICYSINFFLYVIACPSFRQHLPRILLFCRNRSKVSTWKPDMSQGPSNIITDSESSSQICHIAS